MPQAPAAPRRLTGARFGFGIGTSGTVREKHDLGFIVGMELGVERQVEGFFHLGLHGHVSLRNWKVIGDFYGDLVDAKLSEAAIYGYAFGWLSGTGLLAAGPHMTLRSPGPVQPWLSFGTSFILAIDTREETDRAILGHAAFFGAGYDLGSAGVGVRIHWAPADAILFGTTGPSVLAVMGTIEVAEWGDDKPAKRRRR